MLLFEGWVILHFIKLITILLFHGHLFLWWEKGNTYKGEVSLAFCFQRTNRAWVTLTKRRGTGFVCFCRATAGQTCPGDLTLCRLPQQWPLWGVLWGWLWSQDQAALRAAVRPWMTAGCVLLWSCPGGWNSCHSSGDKEPPQTVLTSESFLRRFIFSHRQLVHLAGWNLTWSICHYEYDIRYE